MYIERDIERGIAPWLESREVLAIRGPRQSGKTTLLKGLAERLKKKHGDDKIHYVTLENDLERKRFESGAQEFVDFHKISKGRHFFLLDEVQYVKDAGKILKLLFDTDDGIKLIITGSSTLDLTRIGSSLVGRVLFFELYPFSFNEFLRAKDRKLQAYYEKNRIPLRKPVLRKPLYLPELNAALDEYLTFGGYPRIVLEDSREKRKVLLENLFTTYIEKDVVGLYGVKHKERILASVKYLASVTGNLLNYEEFCAAAGLYHAEAKDILSILQNTYVIRLIRPFHRNLVTELRKSPKVYFIDPGLRNAVLGRFALSQEEKGQLLEGYVLSLLGEASFWRTTAKAEVDFIMEGGVPVEVKRTPKTTRSLLSYIGTYKPGYGIIAALDGMARKRVNSTAIYTLPACLLCR